MHEYETKTVQHYTMYLRVYEEQTYLHVRTGRALIVEAQGKLSATIPSLNNDVLTLSLIKNQGLVDPKRLQRVHRIAGLGSVKRHHQQVHLGLCFTVFSMHACWCLRVCVRVSLWLAVSLSLLLPACALQGLLLLGDFTQLSTSSHQNPCQRSTSPRWVSRHICKAVSKTLGVRDAFSDISLR